MSLEAARGFFRQMIGDEQFRNSINDAETPEERIRLADGAGFQFTSEELEEAMTELDEAGTVDAYMDQDEVLGFTFGQLVGLQGANLMPVYGNGGAPSFFTKQGRVPMLRLQMPGQQMPGQ